MLFTETLRSGIKFTINDNRGACVQKLFPTLVTVFVMKLIIMLIIIICFQVDHIEVNSFYKVDVKNTLHRNLMNVCVCVYNYKIIRVVNNPTTTIQVSEVST